MSSLLVFHNRSLNSLSSYLKLFWFEIPSVACCNRSTSCQLFEISFGILSVCGRHECISRGSVKSTIDVTVHCITEFVVETIMLGGRPDMTFSQLTLHLEIGNIAHR